MDDWMALHKKVRFLRSLLVRPSFLQWSNLSAPPFGFLGCGFKGSACIINVQNVGEFDTEQMR